MRRTQNEMWETIKRIIPLLAVTLVSVFAVSQMIKCEETEHFEKGLCINEVCEKSYAYHQLTGAFCGYIELYNPSTEELFLDNYYVTNDKKKTDNRTYLKGLSINPKGYLLLMADGSNFIEGETHIPVLLEEKEETVYLLNNSGVIVDFVDVPKLDENVSYFRKSDGSSIWISGETTPGIDNQKSDLQKSLQEPIFSINSGFYHENSYLELSVSKEEIGVYSSEKRIFEEKTSGEGADIQIIYTIDGSLPGVDNGILYTEPLHLGELSKRKTLYANRQDVSAGFLEEQIKEAGQEPPGYKSPGDDLDKAVIVRAAVINRHSGSTSKVVTQSYFIGYQDKEAYDGMPVISLVTSPENLFDAYKGIYVLGDFWNRTGPNEEPWEFWCANYTQTGPTWKRPAQIEYFDENKELKWTQTLEISVRGLSSRSYAQKGFLIQARKNLDGNSYITYPFWGDGDELKSMQLSNSGNDTDTKLKDYLMSELLPDRKFSNPKMIPCQLFLNGEYWGMYFVTQNYDKQYIQNYYGVDRENVVIIKNGDVKEGTAKDLQDYHEFERFVIETDFSQKKNFQELCDVMDIQSYLDYYCTQIYISRKRDWPQDNFALWKSRERGTGPYEDGKWRWMLFDVNTEEGELEDYLANFDSIAEVDFHNQVFHALLQIPEVKKQFVLTMMDLYNGYFRAEHATPYIDFYESAYEQAMLLQLERFYGDNKGQKEFETAVNSIRNFLIERPNYIFHYMKEDLLLEGDLAKLIIQTNISEAGEVMINTLKADLSDGNWEGYYYTDYAVTLNAIEKEGFVFKGWEGDISSRELQIEIPMKPDGISVKAVYEKE